MRTRAGRIADCGLRIGNRPAACRPGPARAGCTNKANFGERTGRGSIMRNKANSRQGRAGPGLGGVGREANYAKRTQSADPGPGGYRPGDLTGGAFSRADCAKQTQFAFERNEGQLLWGKGVMVNCTYKRPWKNKANFRRDSNGRGWARPTVLPVGLVVQTNPIPAILPIRRSAFPGG